MSHFSFVELIIKDEQALLEGIKEALNILKREYEILREKNLIGYGSQRQEVLFQVKIKGQTHNIGFRKKADGSFELVVDWYNFHGFNHQEFLRHLKQQYAVSVVKAELKKRNYRFSSQKVDKKIVINCRR